MKSKHHFLILGLAGCFALAAWGLMTVPGTTMAKGKPGGNNGGGGNGQFNTQGYWVWFSLDPLGAFDPNGPAPTGVAPDIFGSFDVVSGAISQPDDPRMIVNFNQTCLDTWNPNTDPSALKMDDQFWTDSPDEFDACFPAASFGTAVISADGTSIQVHIQGKSKSGRDLGYWLTIEVMAIKIDGDVGNPLDVWNPVGDETGDAGLQPGESATLYLGMWVLATSNAKQQSKGCFAMGDFSNEVDLVTGVIGTEITVSRWTVAEQAAHDACE